MRARKKWALLFSQYALLLTGLALLGYCAVVLLQARRYQQQAQAELSRENSGDFPTRDNAKEAVAETQIPSDSTSQQEPSVTSSITTSETREMSGEMAPVARLEIPRIHVSAIVADGTSDRVLRRAIGHIPGTAMPGEVGNVALAAHRDTFFRGLEEIKTGDVIRLTVGGRDYDYSVRFTDVVSPKETWVLGPTSDEALTLITCYPFHYIGPAPKRFVVRAHRFVTQ